MTETVLREIVHRAVRDGSFRAQLRSDPEKALAGFTLTAEARTAITSGDPTRLSALGVDQRMSKAFSAGLLSDASKMVIGTDIGAGVMDLIDEGTAVGSMVIPGDPSAAAPATIVQDIRSLSDFHLKMNEQDLTGAAAVAPVDDARGLMSRQLGEDLPSPAVIDSPAAGAPSHLWQVEQDLDAGASLEAPSGDVQTTGDDTISEY